MTNARAHNNHCYNDPWLLLRKPIGGRSVNGQRTIPVWCHVSRARRSDHGLIHNDNPWRRMSDEWFTAIVGTIRAHYTSQATGL